MILTLSRIAVQLNGLQEDMGLERSYSRVNFRSELEEGRFGESHPNLGSADDRDE